MEDSLQFDRAELSSPAACGACQSTLRDSYFQVSGQALCGTCADQARALMEGTGSRAGRLLWAAMFGIGAGILGAAIYYGVFALTGYNIGLVAIVVGFLVGRAVRKGSGGIGGLGYQFLAAGITYLAIASTFLPMALTQLNNEAAKDAKTPANAAATEVSPAEPDAANASNVAAPANTIPGRENEPMNPLITLVALLALALALPILIALGGGVITLLIVGFGVWEAWRVNKRLVLHITGPHPLAAEVPPLPTATAGV
jgi:hypothetical protein